MNISMEEIIITSSVLILCVILIRHFFRGKISSRLQYALWLLVAVRLLVPASAQIYLSLGTIDEFCIMDLVKKLEANFGDFTERLEQPVGFAVNMDSLIGKQAAEYIPAEDMPEPYTADGATSVFLAGRIGVTWLDVFRGIRFGGMGVMAVWMIAVNFRFKHKLHKERREFLVPEGIEDKLSVKVSGFFFGHNADTGSRRKRRVKAYTLEQLASPCLYGLPGREAIYLPESIVEDENRLRHVLTHEICHKRHGDSFWSLLRSILLVSYWFHPLVWVAAALSKRDCELACDESALLLLGETERIEYGKTLLSIITGKGRLSDFACTATTMTGTSKSIKERIRYIAEKPKVLGTAVAAALVLITAVSMMVFTKSPRFSGGTWSSGNLYIMTGDKQIMLPDTIAGISGFADVEGKNNDLIIYQVASDQEVGRFCTVSYDEAVGLVDAGWTVVPLGNYGSNVNLKQYMGIYENDLHVDTISGSAAEHDYTPSGNAAEHNYTPSGQSEKSPFAFDGKIEWADDATNQSTKKPFLFDGKSEWGNIEQPKEVTENPENGVPGTDSNVDATYLIEDEVAESGQIVTEESWDYIPNEAMDGSTGYLPGSDTADDSTIYLPDEDIADDSTVYLPDEHIIQVEIPPDPHTVDCYIYVTADYSGVKKKYLEEMKYIDEELKSVAGRVIVTEINRDITEETFETLAEHRTLYLGDNSEVLALVNALPQPKRLSYLGIEMKTGTENKSLQINYCLSSGEMENLDRKIMFFDAVMLFATIENVDECIFAIEDEEGNPVREAAYRRAETAEQAGVDKLWKDLDGKELQLWLEELHQRVVTSLARMLYLEI